MTMSVLFKSQRSLRVVCLSVGLFDCLFRVVSLPVPSHPIGGHELSKLLLYHNMKVYIEKSVLSCQSNQIKTKYGFRPLWVGLNVNIVHNLLFHLIKVCILLICDAGNSVSH